MNGSIRVSAKTVDDAITEALVRLGVTSDQLSYEVIEKGSSGFLGIGAKQAVIEACVKKSEVKEEKPDDTDRGSFKNYTHSRGGYENSSYGTGGYRQGYTSRNTESEAGQDKRSYGNYGNQSEYKPRYQSDHRQEQRNDNYRSDNYRSDNYRSDNYRSDNYRSDNYRSDRYRSDYKNNYYRNDANSYYARQNREPVVVDEDTIKRVDSFLKEVLKAINVEANVEIENDYAGLLIELVGTDMGLVIGKRGQTLDSLQYLVNRIVNKDREEYIRVRVDTGNYRRRREDTLRNLARNVAFKVKRTKRAEYLEAMTPYERRIIHSTLQSDPYVTTYSEGNEPFRKVVVAPDTKRM